MSDKQPIRHTFLKTVVAAAVGIATVAGLGHASHASQDEADITIPKGRPCIAIHGGYTSGLDESPEMVNHRQVALAVITAEAEKYLLAPHTAVETADYAVGLLESSCIFNAGVGAKFQSDGDDADVDVRRSASIQDGATGTGGRVEVVPGIEHPVHLAKHLQEGAAKQPENKRVSFSPQGLAGAEATIYAVRHQAEIPNAGLGYHTTRERLDELRKFAKMNGKAEKQSGRHANTGTVGCVVLDAKGNFAAATSTGGTTNNVPGRIGDSGTIAGNYATPLGAVSMTGDGEGIVNLSMASGMLRDLKRMSVDESSRSMFKEAHDKHVSAAAIFIGKGKGDNDVTIRCTDADAAMAFAFTHCDGNVHVFEKNLGQYYGTLKEVKDANLSDDYLAFAKKDVIGAGRSTKEFRMTPELEKKFTDIKDLLEYKIVSYEPGRPVAGIAHSGINIVKLISESRDAK